MARNQQFVKELFERAERERRETQRQNIITAFNMAGSSISSMLMNPKFLVKASYLLFIAFGAFHVTRLGLALITSVALARFGKPGLVRETSKIHTSNYFLIPFIWGRKFFH